MSEYFPVIVDPERIAQLMAHRACIGVEHDPANGKLHGYCVVCGVPWPCDYAGKPPAATQEPAGSGANIGKVGASIDFRFAGSGASNLSMCGVPMEIMGCFICQGEVKNWCPTHGNGAAAPGSQCKCYEFLPDRATRYADLMTGGDGEGWTVTEDCPIHRKAAKERVKDFERREGLYLKFSEPMIEPHTPVIIERVNGDCTVSQFIIARDEAHELIGQLREFLPRLTPQGGRGRAGPIHARDSAITR